MTEQEPFTFVTDEATVKAQGDLSRLAELVRLGVVSITPEGRARPNLLVRQVNALLRPPVNPTIRPNRKKARKRGR